MAVGQGTSALDRRFKTAMTQEPTFGAIFAASFFAGIAIVMLHFV